MYKNNYPKLSIVTPSLNQGLYLEATINSVLSQMYPNLEYIIIDGGSTDESVEIIKKYAHHLHFWCSEPDNGHYSAVNKGFSKASGDIFAWLNSDDMYCPDAFRSVAAIFSQFPGVSWLTTTRQLVWDSQGNRKSVKRIPGYSRAAFLKGRYFSRKFSGFGFIQQESTFWRSQLWEKVGGLRTEFNLAGDFDLWARFFAHEDLYGVDHPLGGFRVHDENRSRQTRQSSKYISEAEHALELMRRKFNCPGKNIHSIILDRIKSITILRRLAKRYNRFLEAPYNGSVISLTDPQSGNKWQMVTTRF
ncbi:MAG: glycosyltransferase [Desulfobacterales bacterium]|nr:glycosyltransferase [Desulfobacterales bacterium]